VINTKLVVHFSGTVYADPNPYFMLLKEINPRIGDQRSICLKAKLNIRALELLSQSSTQLVEPRQEVAQLVKTTNPEI
jgi:hypothetical protein